MRFVKITIISNETPEKYNLNEMLKWFGASLGLFSIRDKDSSCFRIFITLINDLKQGSKGLSSDEMALLTGLSRGTVVFHLNKLIESGLVINADNKYFLKVNNLHELVEEVETNVLRTLQSLKQTANKLDKHLGLQWNYHLKKKEQ